MTPAFLTGSRVYGTPRPDSDWDLVLLVDDATCDALKAAEETCIACGGTKKNSKGGDCVPCEATGIRVKKEAATLTDSDRDHEMNDASFTVGRINMIVLTDPGMFEVWRKGTEFLKGKAPVDRATATKYLRRKRARYYQERNNGEG